MKDTEMLTETKIRTLELINSLATWGLVHGNHGNASGRDPNDEIVFIKPSGFNCGTVSINDLVGVNMEGKTIIGNLNPSIDLPVHLEIYKTNSNVSFVVHTHSIYATAFAIAESSIKAYTTEIADIFGNEIPCIPYCAPDQNLGALLGQASLKHKAVLSAHHGVFLFGKDAQDALNLAIMVEKCAKTVILAFSINKIKPLPFVEVAKWNERYRTIYGQNGNK
jgi:L-ribulose-5-phosphate 4-epimerase